RHPQRLHGRQTLPPESASRPEAGCGSVEHQRAGELPLRTTEEVTDPTVERTLRFARAWGCGASEVVNVFALRSTDPAGLRQVDDPVGPGNDEAILAAAL